MELLVLAGGVVGALVVLFLLYQLGLKRFLPSYRQVPQGKALVVAQPRNQVKVAFTGTWVMPILHRAEEMDISVKTITIDRRGRDGLICQDNIRADISVNFFVKVEDEADAVKKVARTIGCERASDIGTLDNLFNAKFAEALKTAGRQIDFEDLYTMRQEFRNAIIEIVGKDLDGYVLNDVAIDYLEQTPLSSLDPENILDAQGITKITDRTAREHVLTNEHRNEEVKKTTAKNVETREATLALERRQAEAEAKQAREIASIRAREEAESKVVTEQERLRGEEARVHTQLQVNIQQENARREIAVAEKNRERVVAVEAEKIDKARELERVSREVEVTAAQQGLETEKAQVAQVAKARVAAEKEVATQEEAIATLRVIEEARRRKEAEVTAAEAKAQAALVEKIKAAEAAEAAAGHESKTLTILADAELAAAEKTSAAKKKVAEGVQAEAAAHGLADVAVKTADAEAVERQGLARVSVRRAEAEAERQVGLAEAEVVKEKGAAEGAAIEARIRGEAEGLDVKADSMRKLEGVGKDHEEFRLRLEAETKVRMAAVEGDVLVGRANAEAVAASLANAKIDIVGGEQLFVDRLLDARGQGRRIDEIAGSRTVGSVLRPYREGEANLIGDVSGALGSIGTRGLADISLARFLDGLAGQDLTGRGTTRSTTADDVVDTSLDGTDNGSVDPRP